MVGSVMKYTIGDMLDGVEIEVTQETVRTNEFAIVRLENVSSTIKLML
jgi:hypothetical protein